MNTYHRDSDAAVRAEDDLARECIGSNLDGDPRVADEKDIGLGQSHHARAIRRHHARRLKAHRAGYWGFQSPQRADRTKPTPLQLGLLLNCPAMCSGPCCGNPRRWFREITLQERRLLDASEVDDTCTFAPISGGAFPPAALDDSGEDAFASDAGEPGQTHEKARPQHPVDE